MYIILFARGKTGTMIFPFLYLIGLLVLHRLRLFSLCVCVCANAFVNIQKRTEVPKTEGQCLNSH